MVAAYMRIGMFVHPVDTPLRACPTGPLVLPLYGDRTQNTTALGTMPEEWFHPREHGVPLPEE